jgi:hypothetical protein
VVLLMVLVLVLYDPRTLCIETWHKHLQYILQALEIIFISLNV